ncbi:NAD(P)H-dependent oxidoreductase subunit E [bacterium]|nr:NAD(P)H-dependent oxidoreductase subunit E [bacterium]
MKKIGVFVCHCGLNIAQTVDVKRVAEEIGKEPGVVVSEDYPYMCSDPGQNLIKEKIKEHSLDRVVVASCSPTLHESTFMRVVASEGMNKYCFEMANIREHCSWVHSDIKAATQKAIEIIKSALAKSRLLEALDDFHVEVTPNALVIGAGIAGIQAALDVANAGYQVYLVERDSSIGGHMAQLDKTFPTLDCSACILTPKMVDVSKHENIELLSYSEVESVDGFVGNFDVVIKKKPRSIDFDKCTGCGDCMTNCPIHYEAQIPPVPKYSDGIDPDKLRELDKILKRYTVGKEAVPDKEMLILIMQDINLKYNYLPDYALKYLSEKLDIPLTSIYHAATFYTAFSLTPRGEHLVKVCMGTACHARGASRILEEFERQLQIKHGETTPDKKFTLETVNCLGCCALAPVAVIDDDYFMMTPNKVGALLKKYNKE